MLDTLPVGIAFFSGRIIVRCNQRLELMLGYGPGELQGQSSRMLYPSEALWNEAGERYKLLAGGQVLEGEFKLRRKDGSALYCRAVGRAASLESPQASVIVTYSDTSERHAAERGAAQERGDVPQPGRDLERPDLVGGLPGGAGRISARRRCAASTAASRATCSAAASATCLRRK